MRRVLAVRTCGPDLDGTFVAGSSDDIAIFSCVCADIVLAISTDEIEPYNGVFSEPPVSPIPTVYIVGERLNTPVLMIKLADRKQIG
jgi:hypothetical protein